ncbi:MAG TPA: GlsB/YeaQ/YmgE family stress response membrane protein [Acidimicrobiales bacterium]|nr:GlsB/YeaQ/YmgE family stress response membrane protein [Acidimicrobiales bacterium]
MILLFLIVWGLFAGWIANLILGGGMRPDNWGRLLVAGVVGSFVGGLLSSLLAGDGLALRPSGLVGSVVGAVIVLAGAHWWSSRTA